MVKIMKDKRFLIVVSKLRPIVLQDLNLITSKTLVGTSMEKSSIFIPFDGSTNFAPLLPMSQLSHRSTSKDINNNGAKFEFRSR